MNPREAAHHLNEVLQDMTMKKRQRLEDLRPGHHRTHPYQFKELVREAKTVGELVTAYQKISSSHGFHDGLTEMDWNKINAAKKCELPLTDFRLSDSV